MEEIFDEEWDGPHKYIINIKQENGTISRDYLILFYHKQESIENIYKIEFVSDRNLNYLEQRLLAESIPAVLEPPPPEKSKIRAKWYGTDPALKKELQEIINTEQINIRKKIQENRPDPEHEEIISFINRQVNLKKYENQLWE